MSLRLSIVTICYRDLAGLSRTISALRQQVDFDFEQIIVDGNSSDGTKIFLADLIVPWRLRYVSEPDGGIYDAMNKGTKMTSGDFVWYLNAGDIPASKETSRRLLDLLNRNPAADLIYGKVIFDGPYGRRIVGRRVVQADFATGMAVSHPGILFRRALVIQNQYSIKFRIISDWIVTREIFGTAKQVVYVDLIFAIFNVDGISSLNLWQDLWEKLQYEISFGNKINLIIKCGFKNAALKFLKFSGLYGAYKRRQNHRYSKMFLDDPTYPLF